MLRGFCWFRRCVVGVVVVGAAGIGAGEFLNGVGCICVCRWVVKRGVAGGVGRDRSLSIGSSADRQDGRWARRRSSATEGGEGPGVDGPVGDEGGWARGRSGERRGGSARARE